MDSRERVLTALKHQQPDRAPRDLGSTTATGIHPVAYNALKAHYLYKKDVHYVVERGEVIIVDENTGRKMEGRQWSDGLHQAVNLSGLWSGDTGFASK